MIVACSSEMDSGLTSSERNSPGLKRELSFKNEKLSSDGVLGYYVVTFGSRWGGTLIEPLLFLLSLTLSNWRHFLSMCRRQGLQAVEKRDIILS